LAYYPAALPKAIRKSGVNGFSCVKKREGGWIKLILNGSGEQRAATAAGLRLQAIVRHLYYLYFYLAQSGFYQFKK
jgi:hypothetical protein